MSETGARLLAAHRGLRSARRNLDLAIERHEVTESVKNSPVTYMRMHRASISLIGCTNILESALHSLNIDPEET